MPRLTTEEQKKGYVRPTPAPIPESKPQPLQAGQPTRVDVARAEALRQAQASYVTSQELAAMGYPGYEGFAVQPGYEVEKVEKKEVETVGTGRTPFKREVLQVTFVPKEQSYRELEQELLTSGELKPMPSRVYSETEFGGEKPSPKMQLYIQKSQEVMREEAITGYSIVGAVTLPVIAPAVLPAWLGVTTPKLVGAAFLSIGISETAKVLTTGEHLTVKEVAQSAFLGEAFSVVSTGIIGVTGKFIPAVLTPATQAYAYGGVKGLATSVVSRMAISSGIGAGAGYVLSGGDIDRAIMGAGYGALFSLGMEAVQYGITKVGYPKYGKAEIPMESGETATWKGIYWGKGESARLLIGVSDFPEEGMILTRGPSGEAAGWVPQTSLDVAVTKQLMIKLGYAVETLQDIDDVLYLMGYTQYTKSKFIEDLLPTETGTLSEKGVAALKEYVLTHKGDVEKLYGSFTTKPQVSKEFEYALGGTSALRTPGDIDIQLKAVSPEAASQFAQGLLEQLTGVGETVRISPETPTLIEARVGETWAHAVDIHYAGEPITDVLTPSLSQAWGFKLEKPTITIEKIDVMAASEQGLRKGASMLGFTQEGDLMMPQAHRLKDIPDFFQVQRTLIESKTVTSPAAMSSLERLIGRYGIVDIAQQTVAKEVFYVSSPQPVSPPSPLIISTIISPLILASQPISRIESALTSYELESLSASASAYASASRQLYSPAPSQLAYLSRSAYPSRSAYASLSQLLSPSVPSPSALPSDMPSPSPYPSPAPYPSPYPSPADYPSSSQISRLLDISPIDTELKRFKLKSRFMQLEDLYLWAYPVAGPKTVLEELGVTKKRRKRRK